MQPYMSAYMTINILQTSSGWVGDLFKDLFSWSKCNVRMTKNGRDGLQTMQRILQLNWQKEFLHPWVDTKT